MKSGNPPQKFIFNFKLQNSTQKKFILMFAILIKPFEQNYHIFHKQIIIRYFHSKSRHPMKHDTVKQSSLYAIIFLITALISFLSFFKKLNPV
jgi:hypothetical protein